MPQVSLISLARLLGSNTLSDVARKEGFGFPPAPGQFISVRELVRRALGPRPPTDLRLTWDAPNFHSPDEDSAQTAGPGRLIDFAWRDPADTPLRQAKDFFLDIKVALTGQEFRSGNGRASPFEVGGDTHFGTGPFESNTRYSWNVTAVNDFGRASSQTFTFHTVPAPPPPAPKPRISVSSSGSGQSTVFAITGSGFLPNHTVTYRIVDDSVPRVQVLPAPVSTSDSEGKINVRLSIPCTSRLTIHFTATDGRPDPTSVLNQLESNTFDIPCP